MKIHYVYSKKSNYYKQNKAYLTSLISTLSLTTYN